MDYFSIIVSKRGLLRRAMNLANSMCYWPSFLVVWITPVYRLH